MLKIALVGKMRSGKGEFSKALQLFEPFTEINFGDGVRDVYNVIFPFVTTKRKDRKRLQYIGQSLRVENEDVWVDLALSKIIPKMNTENIIVTDVRQRNEAKALQELGFTLVKIEASDAKRLDRMIAENDVFVMEDLKHETEMEIDEIICDYIIENNGSVESLSFLAQKLLTVVNSPFEVNKKGTVL